MRKAFVGILLVAVVAAVALLALKGGGPAGRPPTRALPAPGRAALLLRCVNCQHEFAQSEGQAVPGRPAAVACPHCHKPTPLSSRADPRAGSPR